MLEERFEILSHMVWGVHGDVQKLKGEIAEVEIQMSIPKILERE